MFELVLHRGAQRTYERLPKAVRTRCDRVFAALQREPFRAPQTKRLHGILEGCFRIRIGGWRVIYEVDSDLRTVVIHDIGRRGDVYG